MITAISSYSSLQTALLLILAAILGACVGSFVNYLVGQRAENERLWRGKTHCSACKHELGFLDLVPILSWLFLRGRCRYCKARIPVRYLLVEIVEAVVFVAIVWVYGISIQALAYLCLAGILTALSLVDLKTLTIPNGYIIAGIIVWLATVWCIEVPLGSFSVGSFFVGYFGFGFVAVLVDGLVGAFAVGIFMLLLSLVFDKLTGKRSLGGGDIKLLFMVGLFLGVFGSLFNVLLSCVLGLVFSVVWSAAAKQNTRADEETATQQKGSAASDKRTEESIDVEQSDKKKGFSNTPFPFGPAIAAATVLTLLIGSPCLTWYFDLFI